MNPLRFPKDTWPIHPQMCVPGSHRLLYMVAPGASGGL